MSRKPVTEALTKAAQSYLLHKGFSCYAELAVDASTRRRADVVAVNLKRHIFICEVKSCEADYLTDSKWHTYLDYCDQFVFVFTHSTYESLAAKLRQDLKGTKAGILVLSPTTGYLVSKRPSRIEPCHNRIRRKLITRMAWRGGFSARGHRRTRVFLLQSHPS